MKKNPMPLRGGTYRVDNGELRRDDDAPNDNLSTNDDAGAGAPDASEPASASAASTPPSAPPRGTTSRTTKPQQRAGSPARKR
ncbi:MAG TPA: hypothetical protein VLF18_11915 [Tahibacter sp.]|uniref:hypothetical protein n=1 Tax=Tahibacter sp. TaxID=2056211 RepID=UPI002C32E5C8|nr:hypothetical protein [Tahibacter sp.]HSX60898.1 hypothetical protein [Tahibacter sp.]